MASIRQRTSRTGVTTYSVLFRHQGKQTSATVGTQAAADNLVELIRLVGPERALAITFGEAEPEQPAEPAGPTLAGFLNRHIDELTSAHDGTKARYRGYVRAMPPETASRPLAELTTRDVQTWVAGMQATGKAGKTISNHHGFVAGALNAAVREKLIPANPCESVRLLSSVRVKEPVFMTADQLAAATKAIAERHKPLMLWLVGTGMRYSEATALTIADVDAAACTARVSKAWKYVPGPPDRLVSGPPKSKRSRRTVSFPAALLDGIDMNRPKSALLFPGTGAEPLSPSTFRKAWVRAVKDMDPRPRVHDLRHTCASLMIAAGEPLTVVQAHLGHESIQTTVGVYGHLERGAARRAADAVGAALFGAEPEAPAAPDLADQIRKLGDLHAAGILTDDEFAAKKADLLARI